MKNFYKALLAITFLFFTFSVFASPCKKRSAIYVSTDNTINCFVSTIRLNNNFKIQTSLTSSYVILYPYQYHMFSLNNKETYLINKLMLNVVSKDINEYFETNSMDEKTVSNLKKFLLLHNYFENFEINTGVFFFDLKIKVLMENSINEYYVIDLELK